MSSIFFIQRLIFIFGGRCKPCKCLYSLGVMANKIISQIEGISASDTTSDSEVMAQPKASPFVLIIFIWYIRQR